MRDLLRFCFLPLIALLSKELMAQPSMARDPTKPAIIVETQHVLKQDQVEVVYTLQSIVIGRARRLALINDTFVSMGESVGGATVLAINKNSVVLSESGRTLTIYLFERDIRK